MLKARIKNVGEWKAILNAIGDIVEEAMFIVNDDGITFRGMDPSHVSLLDVTFPKSSFEELESKTSFFGLRIEDFKKVMNTASNGDVVELLLNGSNLMNVSIKGSLSAEYNIRLIQKEGVNTPIPKAAYTAKLAIEPNTLGRIISNIQNISDYLTITCNSERVEFSGKGEAGDAKIDLPQGTPELKNLVSSENSSAAYSLEYMARVIRDLGRASKMVNMEYADKNPIHILFEMPSKAMVNYYLAPKVPN